jgi:RNA polymerase sigma factor (sigma-70 family)
VTDVFEEHRARLWAVAYRMLGSRAEADDAVQEAWVRVHRAEPDGLENPGAWLTTVLARVCLNLLRSRASRREQPLEVHMPDPIIGPATGGDPEQEAMLADAVGLALQVVLDELAPAERLAFVLHDMFGVPFDDIAPMIERSPAAARQLASRARRRVRGAAPAPDPDPARQRAVVDAFYAATREGDFDALVAVLDPEVVLRADGGPARPERTVVLHGAREVAEQASRAAQLSRFVRPALVNGAAGGVVVARGRVLAVMGFAVVDGRIAAIDVLYDPDRLTHVDPAVLG